MVIVDKKDVMYIVAALALVLVIALVIKPIATGQPIETGIPVPSTTLAVTIIPPQNTSGISQFTITPRTPVPTTSPKPTPTWNPNAVQTVAFVDPSQYGLSTNQSTLMGTRMNNTPLIENMTIFATIASSTGGGGTTNIMYIPFPYWELVYTISPNNEILPVTTVITPTKGVGIAYSGISGSYSSARPEFTVIVMDGDDPNRIVRTITPPGGIDSDLWAGKSRDEAGKQIDREADEDLAAKEKKELDPRPWTEKFYEGQRNYYFVIKTQSIQSYSMTIQVPTRYIGKY